MGGDVPREARKYQAEPKRMHVPVTTAVECRPASEMSWIKKPALPRSQTNDLSCSSVKPCAPQLNDGDKL